MDFDITNAIYRMRNNRQEKNFFLVETSGEKNYVLDKKYLELILVEGYSLASSKTQELTKRTEINLGENAKKCEKFELNERGELFYLWCEIEERAKNFFPAIKEMKKGKKPGHYLEDKIRLEKVFELNKITSISKFTPTESTEEKTATRSF